MTKESISFTSEPRVMLLSHQIDFSFVRAEVACSIIERTSGFELSSEAIAPRYTFVVVVLLFYVHGKHLRSYRDDQLT